MQPGAPTTFEKVPEEHSRQPLSKDTRPAPVPCCPGGHGEHVPFEDAPNTELYLPLVQFAHTGICLFSSNMPYFPFGHSEEHSRKGGFDDFPIAQVKHSDLPVSLENFPTTHHLHDAELVAPVDVLCFPAGSTAQCFCTQMPMRLSAFPSQAGIHSGRHSRLSFCSLCSLCRTHNQLHFFAPVPPSSQSLLLALS